MKFGFFPYSSLPSFLVYSCSLLTLFSAYLRSCENLFAFWSRVSCSLFAHFISSIGESNHILYILILKRNILQSYYLRLFHRFFMQMYVHAKLLI